MFIQLSEEVIIPLEDIVIILNLRAQRNLPRFLQGIEKNIDKLEDMTKGEVAHVLCITRSGQAYISSVSARTMQSRVRRIYTKLERRRNKR